MHSGAIGIPIVYTPNRTRNLLLLTLCMENNVRFSKWRERTSSNEQRDLDGRNDG